MHTFIIAEAAGCHDGDFQQALALVKLAAAIGADACKFQWTSSPEAIAARRHAPEYIRAYRTLAFHPDWHRDLAIFADGLGLEYMCTVYLAEDIPVIARYVKRFKIASFEATDISFVNAHMRHGKPLLISCGMNATVMHNGRQPVTYLHCVSAYPAPDDEMNLRVLRDPATQFRGLSDHSQHPWTGALAVAAGAEIIEFHIRLDDTSAKNADYDVAKPPREAAAYVANIRTAECMLGSGECRVMPSEQAMLRYRVRSEAP